MNKKNTDGRCKRRERQIIRHIGRAKPQTENGCNDGCHPSKKWGH